NSASFAGHNDWRLPNVRELGSIVNFQDAHLSVSPAFNTGCTTGCTPTTCSCTAADAYWSSTPDWGVNFSVGQGGTPTVGGGGVFARAVRGGSSCLPATGETTCADSNGNMIPCAGTGQDGDLKKGAPLSYTD